MTATAAAVKNVYPVDSSQNRADNATASDAATCPQYMQLHDEALIK
jgi:hypothetical protein